MPPYLGGHRITGITPLSARTYRIAFASAWGTLYCYQLYSGRSLVGVSAVPAARYLVARIEPSDWPEPLQLLAVTPGNRATDYGAGLPPRPYNRVLIEFDAAAWPSDSKLIEVASGTTPGGAVDPNNVVAKVTYDVDRRYSVLTPSRPGNGTWNLRLTGRDDLGNAGTSVDDSQHILTHPPDVDQVNGERLDVAINAGSVTLSAEFS